MQPPDARPGDLEDLANLFHRHLVAVVEANDEQFALRQPANGVCELIQHQAPVEPVGEISLANTLSSITQLAISCDREFYRHFLCNLSVKWLESKLPSWRVRMK